MKVKQRNGVVWSLIKISLCITISMKNSQQDLFIDIVVDWFIFKNNQIKLSPCFTFTPKTGMGLPSKVSFYKE